MQHIVKQKPSVCSHYLAKIDVVYHEDAYIKLEDESFSFEVHVSTEHLTIILRRALSWKRYGHQLIISISFDRKTLIAYYFW